jgi:hypothetical protein
MSARKSVVCLVILCLLHASLLFSQSVNTAIVKGQIVDRNNRPLVRVKVTIDKTWTYSDLRGRYVMKGITYGSHELTLEYRGKKVVKGQITIGQSNVVKNLSFP